jgi:hypothetical protein
VEAFVTIEISPSGLSLASSAVFATMAINWADSRVAYAEQITGARADGAARVEQRARPNREASDAKCSLEKGEAIEGESFPQPLASPLKEG